MAFNGSGTYVTLTPPTYPAVTGQTIRPDYFNSIIDDIAAGLSNTICRDGQSLITQNIPFNGKKVTNLGSATADTDAPTFLQLQTYQRGQVATINMGGGSVTLTQAQYNARILSLTGVLPSDVNLNLPLGVEGTWILVNGTTGNFGISFQVSGSGTPITVASGTSIVFSNGTQTYKTLADRQELDFLYGYPTGTFVFVHDTAAPPSGWVQARRDYTLGSSASGATYATSLTLPLFRLMWASAVNSVYTSGGVLIGKGASADADFAANRRCEITDMRGEFVRGWDAGRGVDTGRLIGSFVDEQLGYHSHNTPIPHGDGTNFSPYNPPVLADTDRNYSANLYAYGSSFSGGVDNGGENRPRSIALQGIFKL